MYDQVEMHYESTSSCFSTKTSGRHREFHGVSGLRLQLKGWATDELIGQDRSFRIPGIPRLKKIWKEAPHELGRASTKMVIQYQLGIDDGAEETEGSSQVMLIVELQTCSISPEIMHCKPAQMHMLFHLATSVSSEAEILICMLILKGPSNIPAHKKSDCK